MVQSLLWTRIVYVESRFVVREGSADVDNREHDGSFYTLQLALSQCTET
jgi:hypothetical protein